MDFEKQKMDAKDSRMMVVSLSDDKFITVPCKKKDDENKNRGYEDAIDALSRRSVNLTTNSHENEVAGD